MADAVRSTSTLKSESYCGQALWLLKTARCYTQALRRPDWSDITVFFQTKPANTIVPNSLTRQLHISTIYTPSGVLHHSHYRCLLKQPWCQSWSTDGGIGSSCLAENMYGLELVIISVQISCSTNWAIMVPQKTSLNMYILLDITFSAKSSGWSVGRGHLCFRQKLKFFPSAL